MADQDTPTDAPDAGHPDPAAVNPSAVNPSAEEPSAVNPSAKDPAASGSSSTETAAGEATAKSSTSGSRPAAGNSQQARKPRRGDEFEVRVGHLDERGRGVAEAEGYTFTLRFTNPGATVLAQTLRRKGQKIEARPARVIDPGPHDAEARCPHAGVCGGCALPRLTYAEQLRQKHAIVERALAAAFGKVGLGEIPAVSPPLGAERLEGYRNKMDFTFGARRYVLDDEPQGVEAGFALGLHAPGVPQKVLDVEHCAIAFDTASPILRSARELALERGLSAWDTKTHTGLLRHLVVRAGFGTGDLMVDLVTSAREAETIEPYVAELLKRHPEITTVVQNITTRLATVSYGEEEHILHGPGTIDEVILGRRFRVSADSFFQTNSEQAEVLMGLIRDAAELQPGATLFDLYCGAGTIGLALAREDCSIIGFESVASAVRDARRNAEVNGISSATFHEGDVLKTLAEVATERAPDVVVVDPPRAGLHPKVPAHVLALRAPRLVYVSCNPKTGASDVAQLVASGDYAVRSVQPIDLFPHTPHVEVVFRLDRVR